MAKITITIEDDSKITEELAIIVKDVIKVKPKPNKYGYCSCPDHLRQYFGCLNECGRCSGMIY